MKKVQKSICYGVIATIVASTVLLLSGCGTQTFRNRNFDYLQQNVQELPPLKVPQDVKAPNTTPYNQLPSYAQNFPANGQVILTPPGYTTAYNAASLPKTAAVPTPPVAPVASAPAAETKQQKLAPVAPAMPTVIAKPAMSEVAPVAVTQASAPTNVSQDNTLLTLPTAAKNNTQTPVYNQEPAVAVGTVPNIPHVAPESLVSLPGYAPLVKAAPAKTVTPVVARVSAAAKVQTPLVPPVVAKTLLNSTYSQDASDVPSLTIDAAFGTVWSALPMALRGSGFETLVMDYRKGFYYIMPVDQTPRGHTRMLYLSAIDAHTTNLTLFGTDGNLDGSARAAQLMRYIQAHLYSF